jgi:hypothetical protein
MNKMKMPGLNGTTLYHGDRPVHVKPVIMDNVRDEKGTVTHYLCEGNRLFIKTTYDRVFGNGVKGKVKAARYKGINPDSRRVY